MNYRYVLPVLTVAFLTSCSGIDKKFKIEEEQVGLLSKNMNMRELDSIYAKDSLVKTTLEGEFRYASDERFIVYEKGKKAKELLELTPSAIKQGQDQYITSIEIKDERFKTKEGITKGSTFGEIKKVYKKFDIQESLYSVNVTPQGSNIYFVYKKSDLMASPTGILSEKDIPDGAKMDRMLVNWIR